MGIRPLRFKPCFSFPSLSSSGHSTSVLSPRRIAKSEVHRRPAAQPPRSSRKSPADLFTSPRSFHRPRTTPCATRASSPPRQSNSDSAPNAPANSNYTVEPRRAICSALIPRCQPTHLLRPAVLSKVTVESMAEAGPIIIVFRVRLLSAPPLLLWRGRVRLPPPLFLGWGGS